MLSKNKLSFHHVYGFLVVALLFGARAYASDCTPQNFSHRLATCAAGDTLILAPGVYMGSFEVTQSITVIGRTGAILDGGHKGTVLRILAPSVVIEGLAIRRSGDSLVSPDCGIYIATEAVDTIIRSCEVRECAFGVWFHAVHGAEISHCMIYGAKTGHTSNRGNGIQIFDCLKMKIHDNKVYNGRDGIYISATEESDIYNNYITGARYAVHYMYSYNNRIWGNVCEKNQHGYALMTSKHLKVYDNKSIDNMGHGLMFRDAQYCIIQRNILDGNGEGMFFYSSTENEIIDNIIRNNTVGIKVWAGSYRNKVQGNRFIGNRQQIFYHGLTDIYWGVNGRGNYWSDYMGWDQDGDGIGDIPYRVNSFSARMQHRFPQSVVLLNSPAMELLSHLESRLPVLKTTTIIDSNPLIQ